jgi:uncharacterized protein (TIGR02246 family)
MTTTLERELDLAHTQMIDALVAGDTETLRRLVHEDCQIVGPKGFHIGADEWIGTHASHVYTQVSLEIETTEVRQFGDAAIKCDLQRSECLYNGETIKGLYRVLHTWVREGDQWRLAALQYTAATPESLA